MQIRISKRDDGKAMVVVVPPKRQGQPAVMVRGVTEGNLRKVVKQLIWESLGRVPPEPGEPGG